MNSKMNILEWRQTQRLGEIIDYESRIIPGEETHIVTASDFSENGSHFAVGDKGGRVVIFENKERKNKLNQKEQELNYLYEFGSMERDFNYLNSKEYFETIRDLKVFNSQSSKENINLLLAGYRKIKLESVYIKAEREFENEAMISPPNGKNVNLKVPKLKNVTKTINNKTKKEFAVTHQSGIKNLSFNCSNRENFISCDKKNIYLWDVNYSQKTFNIVDLSEEEEKIRVAKYSERNPSLIAYSTNRGHINICDLRVSSEIEKNAQMYCNIKNIKRNLWDPSLDIQDMCFSDNSSFYFATRHMFSIKLWDSRKQTNPVGRYFIYEPLIKNYEKLISTSSIKDKFKLKSSQSGKYLLTGGYNNMFHVLDLKSNLNCQVVIDDSNKELSNHNIFRKFNSKGYCVYNEKEKTKFVDLNKKLSIVNFSPIEDKIVLGRFNCLYEYKANCITV